MRSITPRSRILFVAAGAAPVPRVERCSPRSTAAHAGGRPSWRGVWLSAAAILAEFAIQSRAALLDCARVDDSIIVGSAAAREDLDAGAATAAAPPDQEPPGSDFQARAMRACMLTLAPRLIAIPRLAALAQA